MKTTQKDFDLFKSDCQKWQKIFELSHWRINYYWQKLRTPEAFAEIRCNAVGRVAHIAMADDWALPNKITEKDIDTVAKHEMLHLLSARVKELGMSRWVRQEEFVDAIEETIKKLENIIQ